MSAPDISALLALNAHIWDTAECRYCHDAIADGDTCIECWRDLRELDNARNKEWWS